MRIGGIEFTDKIVRCEDWDKRKAEFEGIGLSQLPILKVDDRIFCQSDAIFEWAAKKAILFQPILIKHLPCACLLVSAKDLRDTNHCMEFRNIEGGKTAILSGIHEGCRSSRP